MKLNKPLHIKQVFYLQNYQLWLQFNDGSDGKVDLEGELWGDMFEPLKDVDLFKQVKLNPDLGTITWPNGADLAPEFLLALIET